MAMEVWWRGMIRKATAAAAAPLPTIPPPPPPLFRHHHRCFYYYSRGVVLVGRPTTEAFQQCRHHHRRCCCYHLARPPLLQIPRPSQAQPPSSTTVEYTPLLLLLHMHSPRWLSFKPAKAKAKTPPTADGTSDEQAWSDDDAWEEEEEEKEPQIGDGGDGGGIVLEDVAWGQQVLSIANEILQAHFQDSSGGLRLFAFRVTHKGYIYVRLDKLSHKYGCPSIDEIEHFNRLYDKHLEESGKRGETPDNLAIEVSSPGLERLLRVPDDLERFQDLPLVLKYLEEDVETRIMHEKEGVFFVASIDNETKQCVWKLADVKDDRNPLRSKGRRRLSREKKEWRLNLPFQNVKSVTFYV